MRHALRVISNRGDVHARIALRSHGIRSSVFLLSGRHLLRGTRGARRWGLGLRSRIRISGRIHGRSRLRRFTAASLGCGALDLLRRPVRGAETLGLLFVLVTRLYLVRLPRLRNGAASIWIRLVSRSRIDSRIPCGVFFRRIGAAFAPVALVVRSRDSSLRGPSARLGAPNASGQLGGVDVSCKIVRIFHDSGNRFLPCISLCAPAALRFGIPGRLLLGPAPSVQHLPFRTLRRIPQLFRVTLVAIGRFPLQARLFLGLQAVALCLLHRCSISTGMLFRSSGRLSRSICRILLFSRGTELGFPLRLHLAMSLLSPVLPARRRKIAVLRSVKVCPGVKDGYILRGFRRSILSRISSCVIHFDARISPQPPVAATVLLPAPAQIPSCTGICAMRKVS